MSAPLPAPSADDRRAWITAALGTAVCVLLLAHLGGYPLWDPDEGRHAEIARELWRATAWRGWLLPSHNGAPYHDKPILYYWLTALAFATIGPTEAAARLVSVVAAATTLVVLHRWTAARFDRPTARLASAVLATSVGFFGLGRYGSLDMLLTCWITIGLVEAERFLVAPVERRGAGLRAAAAAGLGMLTKGLVAPLLVVGIPLLHAALARRRLPGGRALLAPALVVVAVALPWYVVAGVLDPAYPREFLLVHHLARFARDTTTFHAGPWWYYGPALALLCLPWSFLLPAAVRSATRERDAARYCLVWAATVVLFFSCSHGKLATYVLPALPPLAVLVARALRGDERALVRGGVAGAVVLLACGPALVAGLGPGRIPAPLLALAPLLCVLPASALVVTLAWWRGGTTGAAAALAACMLVVGVGFYARVAPVVSELASEREIAAAIDGQPPAAVIAYDVIPASLLFYLGRPVTHLTRPAALRDALAVHPFAWIVTSPRHVDDVVRAGGAYPWRIRSHHLLYATAPPPRDARAPTTPAAIHPPS